MSTENTEGGFSRVGIPSEEQSEAQRQTEFDAVTRRYSTMVPTGAIREEGQVLLKASRRRWSGWVILALWVVGGIPLVAMLVVSLTQGHGSLLMRIWGAMLSCLIWGIPLYVLVTMTRNWFSQRGKP